MLRNTYLNENRMFTNKVNKAILWGGNEKMVIKRVKIMREFEKVFEGRAFLKVGPSGPKV